MPLTQTPREALYDHAYSEGSKLYGDLGLSTAEFAARLASVIQKYLGPIPAETAVADFLLGLRTNDLYLSCACAVPSELAWRRFESDYRTYFFDIANQACESREAADDLARGVLADLFLPDRSGQSRIASFEGRCSLASWLRVVIERKA